METSDERIRREREEWRRWVEFRAWLKVQSRELDVLAREVKQVAALVMRSAGYHQHDRGAWRRRRVQPVREESVAELNTLMATARQSEAAARRHFDAFIGVDPDQAADTTDLLIKLHDGDLIQTHERRLLAQIEPVDHLRREALRRRVMQLRTDLEGPGPVSAVERIIIDRVLVCWLSVMESEARVIRAGDSGSILSQKHLDHASKRLNDVVKALSQIRKTPASHRLSVQVLGDVNLGMPVPTAASPTVIDLTPLQTNAIAEENEHGSDPGRHPPDPAQRRVV